MDLFIHSGNIKDLKSRQNTSCEVEQKCIQQGRCHDCKKTVKCNLSFPSISDAISISANNDQGFAIIIKIGQGQILS